ncbi:MAG: serpin family protein [Candidatus Obscuribacterales bacterium]|nr:serpin family protein [Candidatus Obscuribacterales bacterium]
MTSPRLLAPTAKFGLGLLAQELGKSENKGKNVIISPLSASIALGMTASGARGDTLKEMNKALGLPDFGDVDNASNSNSYANLLAALKGKDLGVIFKIASAVWAREGVEFRDTFLGGISKSFKGDVKYADFGEADELLAEINGWVSEKTKEKPSDAQGKITKLLEKINPDAVLYLLNALYFKGSWKTKFDKSKTQDATFHAVDGDKQHPLMYRGGNMRYAKRDGYQIVALPFGEKEGRVHLYVLLPAEGKTVTDVAQKLDGDKFFTDCRDNLLESDGQLWLPRFKLDYTAKLNDSLQALGMKKAFGGADFSGMHDTEKLCISSVIQKVVCSFDEEGGELAAATAVAVTRECVRMPWKMRVDRPFIAVLADEDTGAVIGAGAVVNP